MCFMAFSNFRQAVVSRTYHYTLIVQSGSFGAMIFLWLFLVFFYFFVDFYIQNYIFKLFFFNSVLINPLETLKHRLNIHVLRLYTFK